MRRFRARKRCPNRAVLEGFWPCTTSIKRGQHVLVYGASGANGRCAVQLAKHFGAVVTAVCSTANVELARSLGADTVLDYTTEQASPLGR